MLVTLVVKADADALREGRCVGWATDVATGEERPFTTSEELSRILGEAATAATASEERP